MYKLNKEQVFFSKVKSEFKAHCTKQGFCFSCKYKTPSGDKVDCFEKYYLQRSKEL